MRQANVRQHVKQGRWGAGRGVWEVVATSLSLRAQNVSRSRKVAQ